MKLKYSVYSHYPIWIAGEAEYRIEDMSNEHLRNAYNRLKEMEKMCFQYTFDELKVNTNDIENYSVLSMPGFLFNNNGKIYIKAFEEEMKERGLL
ncbi:MAG: hypothetical protein NC205_05675 [Prevotella sp.]|nr:hypothetical protein [Alistipes senegalensis]MCM1358065.1 hypothetical protein [Prevotella sp.]MCM1473423.1 hypothetical protein [Muribaculaceae bacterium]